MLRFHRARGRPRPIHPGEITLGDPAMRERAALLRVTPDDVGTLAAWRDACAAVVPAAAESIVARLASQPASAARLDARTSREPERASIARYATALLAGRIDDAYVAARVRMGHAHAAAGADVTVLLLAGDALREAFAHGLVDAGATASEHAAFDASLARVLRFDVAVVAQALQDATLGAAAAAHAAERMHERRDEPAPPSDTAQRFIAEASDVLASLASRDLRPRLHGAYGPALDTVKRAINQTMDDLERRLRAVARVGASIEGAGREVAAGARSVAQGAAAQASAAAAVSAELRAVARDATPAEIVARLAPAIAQLDTLAGRTAANAEAGAASADALAAEAGQLERMASAYTLRASRSGSTHPRRRRTDLAPTEPVAQEAVSEPAAGTVPTRFRRERRRSLFTDN